jgi:hypothetical protein
MQFLKIKASFNKSSVPDNASGELLLIDKDREKKFKWSTSDYMKSSFNMSFSLSDEKGTEIFSILKGDYSKAKTFTKRQQILSIFFLKLLPIIILSVAKQKEDIDNLTMMECFKETDISISLRDRIEVAEEIYQEIFA